MCSRDLSRVSAQFAHKFSREVIPPALNCRASWTIIRALDSLFVRLYFTYGLINQMVHHNMWADRLSTTFAALADPTRRAILARLARGEASVTELAGPFSISLPAISKHLKVLERAGLIARGRDAQWRPCRLEAGPLMEAAAWLEHYRLFWEQSFDRLDDYLNGLKKKEKKYGRKKK
jgi:DNA-binding transcriptional ArsR family regulator